MFPRIMPAPIHLRRPLRLVTTVLLAVALFATASVAKPKVIVMTDGEIDDHSSMIRFLLYTCDVDVQAIIETNSMFQRTGHSKEPWYENQLAAYETIHPNLIKHHPGYPTAEKLRAIHQAWLPGFMNAGS